MNVINLDYESIHKNMAVCVKWSELHVCVFVCLCLFVFVLVCYAHVHAC